MTRKVIFEFDAIFEEFCEELDALKVVLDGLSQPNPESVSPKARISGANASVLLLAAIFEEFVRQTVKESFVKKVSAADAITDLGKKIQGTVWRKSLSKLSRVSLDELLAEPHSIAAQVQAMTAFCIDGKVDADVGAAISHNERNMTSSQITELFSAVGVGNVFGQVGNNASIRRDLLLGPEENGGDKLKLRIDEFYRQRNTIAHAISLRSSSRPDSILSDVAFFRSFGRALTEVCREFPVGEQPLPGKRPKKGLSVATTVTQATS